MDAPPATTGRLHQMPLWRLLVLLDDAEREVGASSQTARALARLVRDRLRGQRPQANKAKAGRASVA